MNNLSTIYKFLAKCFTYPEKDFIEQINDDSLWLDLMNTIKTNNLPIVNTLEVFAEAVDKVQEEDLERLAVENTRLFINGYPKIVVSPYADKYLDLEPENSKATMEMVFATSGLKVNETWKDRPDHFLLALEFVAFGLDQDKQELVEDFMAKFGLKWLIAVFTNVMDNTEVEYYYVLAKLAKEWMQTEEAKYKA